jgi:signal transduction histidine kinase
MRPSTPAFLLHVLLVLLACLGSGTARAHVVAPDTVEVLAAPAATPTALPAQGWTPTTLPHRWSRDFPAQPVGVAWYRLVVTLPAHERIGDGWSLYLPYLHDGGRLWLNGAPLAAIPTSTEATRVRWERPHLLALPEALLRPGRNELLVRATLATPGVGLRFPRAEIGPTVDLQPRFDRRLFVVRTLPQTAVAASLLVGAFVLFVWWRRRSEVLYGLFGLAALLWAVRTLTFVVEVMPADWWPWWRAGYHAATGGFIVVLAVFAMRFAGLRAVRAERALALYWLVGPLAMLASGGQLDSTVGFVWTGGLIPVGLAIVGFTAWAAWRQRSGAAIALAAAVAVATLAGIHDYFVAWDGRLPALPGLAAWMEHRIFLLHHGANLLLLVMVAILTMRFVDALDTTEELNRTLEDRVAARDQALRAQHAQVARLEREQAALDERQRIMQDLHDGLGSQLFTSLARLERGALEPAGVAQVLRDCIAEMRMVFDVAMPADTEFASVLGDFLARWQGLLDGAGVRLQRVIALDAPLHLAAGSALQVLRIVQEALTNVMKHAQAGTVRVELRREGDRLLLTVQDDGRGAPAAGTAQPGRGLAYMDSRARRLGAVLVFAPRDGGTTVTLDLPLADHER